MENFQNLLITLLVFSLSIKKTLIALHNLQKRNKLIHYNIVEKKFTATMKHTKLH